MYEFSEADLKYNKRGQLSPSQLEWLKMIARASRKSSRTNTAIAIVFMFVGLCVVIGLFLSNEGSRAVLFADRTNLVILAAVIPVILGILGLAIFLNYRNANKLENAVISSASGAVRFDRDYSSESNLATYYVIVGKKKFKFGEDMSSKFTEGGKYKFYYCNSGTYEFVMSYEQM